MVEAEGDEGEASLVHAKLVALALAGVDATKDSVGVAGGFVEVAGHFGDGDGEVKGEVGWAEGDGVCGEVGGGLFEGGGGVLAFGKVGVEAELFEGGAEDGGQGIAAGFNGLQGFFRCPFCAITVFRRRAGTAVG